MTDEQRRAIEELVDEAVADIAVLKQRIDRARASMRARDEVLARCSTATVAEVDRIFGCTLPN